MRQHSIILINLFVNSEKIVNTIGCDYIFSCDNIIYDCYIYLYFTLKNALKLFKYRIEFKEFRIGNFKGLANAFDKILNHSYNIKQKLFLKKINQSSTASINSFLYFSKNSLTASCHALFNGSLSYLRLARALNFLKSFLLTVADVLKKSFSVMLKPPKCYFMSILYFVFINIYIFLYI